MNAIISRGSLLAVCFLALLASCKKEDEVLDVEPLSDYLPLEPGKYITYRLDSTVTTNFGVGLTVKKYQMRHMVDAEITDNLGRPSYRVFRYLNNENGTGEWVNNGTYLITRTDKEVELIEDNLRFIKMHAPLREGFEWKGNSYLPDKPYASQGFSINTVDYMKNWDYYYDGFSSSEEINGETYTDVYTVEEENISGNYPFSPDAAGFNFRSYEKYSKNIGLVFRSTTILEYDPNPSGTNPTYSGFAVDMWMIDHN